MDDHHHHLEKSPSAAYLSHLPRDESPQPRWHHPSNPHRDRTLCRRIYIAISLFLATWILTRSLLPYILESSNNTVNSQRTTIENASSHPFSGNKTHRVALEAHIMSKCPDAKACLHELVVPAMEKVSDKVDFELSFIGT